MEDPKIVECVRYAVAVAVGWLLAWAARRFKKL